MAEDNKKEENQDLVIKTIKEEYEKQIADLKAKHEEEIKKVREEEQEKSVKQIKALMSGRTEEINSNKTPTEELSYEEQALRDTRKLLGLKEEN